MKHKAVEALVRIQFNIPEEEPVKVEFLAFYNNKYYFEVSWYSDEGDFYHQCNLTLPHISFLTKDFAC